MITIYGRANSINVRKVLWLCEDIGLEFDRLDYGRGFKDATSPELVALNPHALVPVVVDGDVVVWESNSCMRYLNGKYGKPELYPADLVARTHIDQWMDWQLGHFQEALRPIFFGRFLKNPDFDKPEMINPAIEHVANMMQILSAQIDKAGGYMAADHLTIADMAIAPGVHRWMVLVPEADNPKPLVDYYQRLDQSPGFKKWVRIEAP